MCIRGVCLILTFHLVSRFSNLFFTLFRITFLLQPSMPVRVAVIGGGVVGLMALKNFREDGFDATLYEGRAWVGGLWKYSDDEWLSTAENTKFNSSKFRTAIPDFPFSKHVDDFPTASQLYEYLNAYCQHFDLWPHVKLSSRVTSVKRSGERWALEVTPNDAPSYTAHYDKVAFACGSFTSPRQPTLDGIDQFKGRALHAVNFHNPSQFEGQNVLVVGAHASAQDVVAQLSEHASHVYLSHRSGVLLVGRSAVLGRRRELISLPALALLLRWLRIRSNAPAQLHDLHFVLADLVPKPFHLDDG